MSSVRGQAVKSHIFSDSYGYLYLHCRSLTTCAVIPVKLVAGYVLLGIISNVRHIQLKLITFSLTIVILKQQKGKTPRN